MMKHRIAFYVGTSNKLISAIQQWGIRLWTLGKFSHCEFVVGEGDDPREWYWSAATSYSPGVTTIRKMPNYKPSHWVIYDLPDGYDYSDAVEWTKQNLNKKYDWVGIFLSQFIKLNIDEKNKFFCSEFNAHQLQEAGILSEDEPAESYSPNSLYRELKRLGVLTKWQK